MKDNIYRNAVDHLEFSACLYENVMKTTPKPRYGLRLLRSAALAAVMMVVLATTAFAVSPEFREWTVSLFKLGVSEETMADAQVMNFTVSEDIEGVTVHYLELDKANYTFIHGMLYNAETGFTQITGDYRLETVETENFLGFLEKNGRKYFVNLDYVETEAGILARRKSVLHKNDRGELFLVARDGNSNQWPVYVNLETGEIRDALPDWTNADFEGRVIYADLLKGGILVSTIVNDGVVVEGKTVSNNMLYWIGDGAKKAKVIELPDDEYDWYCENGELYYKNQEGYLFRLNDGFEFEQITAYKTGDDLTNGLLTAATENNELVIVDVLSGDQYVIEDGLIDPGEYDAASGGRINVKIDETMGYNATRYSADGKIALVQTEWIAEEGCVALLKLGILDTESGELKLLEIENSFDGYHNSWLDDYRYAVMYEDQNSTYLCIYEFEE